MAREGSHEWYQSIALALAFVYTSTYTPSFSFFLKDTGPLKLKETA
jgi:hypothetical protein